MRKRELQLLVDKYYREIGRSGSVNPVVRRIRDFLYLNKVSQLGDEVDISLSTILSEYSERDSFAETLRMFTGIIEGNDQTAKNFLLAVMAEETSQALNELFEHSLIINKFYQKSLFVKAGCPGTLFDEIDQTKKVLDYATLLKNFSMAKKYFPNENFSAAEILCMTGEAYTISMLISRYLIPATRRQMAFKLMVMFLKSIDQVMIENTLKQAVSNLKISAKIKLEVQDLANRVANPQTASVLDRVFADANAANYSTYVTQTSRPKASIYKLLEIVERIVGDASWAEKSTGLRSIFFSPEKPDAIKEYYKVFNPGGLSPLEVPANQKWQTIQRTALRELKNLGSTQSDRLLALHQAIADSDYDALQEMHYGPVPEKKEEAKPLPLGIKTLEFWRNEFTKAGLLPDIFIEAELFKGAAHHGMIANPKYFYGQVVFRAASAGKKDMMELAFTAMMAEDPRHEINLHQVFRNAASSGDVATIQSALTFFELKKQAFNPNDADWDHGMSAWHCAASSGNVDAIRFVACLPGVNLHQVVAGFRAGMCDHGPRIAKPKDRNALDYAKDSGKPEAIRLVSNYLIGERYVYVAPQPERKEVWRPAPAPKPEVVAPAPKPAVVAPAPKPAVVAPAPKPAAPALQPKPAIDPKATIMNFGQQNAALLHTAAPPKRGSGPEFEKARSFLLNFTITAYTTAAEYLEYVETLFLWRHYSICEVNYDWLKRAALVSPEAAVYITACRFCQHLSKDEVLAIYLTHEEDAVNGPKIKKNLIQLRPDLGLEDKPEEKSNPEADDEMISEDDVHCPISHVTFEHPVKVFENMKWFYFEKAVIMEALKKKKENPLTRQPLNEAMLRSAPNMVEKVKRYQAQQQPRSIFAI
jgi:hypothetical protein